MAGAADATLAATCSSHLEQMHALLVPLHIQVLMLPKLLNSCSIWRTKPSAVCPTVASGTFSQGLLTESKFHGRGLLFLCPLT
jgi:hypothetical protein